MMMMMMMMVGNRVVAEVWPGHDDLSAVSAVACCLYLYSNTGDCVTAGCYLTKTHKLQNLKRKKNKKTTKNSQKETIKLRKTQTDEIICK